MKANPLIATEDKTHFEPLLEGAGWRGFYPNQLKTFRCRHLLQNNTTGERQGFEKMSINQLS